MPWLFSLQSGKVHSTTPEQQTGRDKKNLDRNVTLPTQSPTMQRQEGTMVTVEDNPGRQSVFCCFLGDVYISVSEETYKHADI